MNKQIIISFLAGTVITATFLSVPWKNDSHEHHHDEDEHHDHLHLSEEQKEKAKLETVEVKKGEVTLTLPVQAKVILHPQYLIHLVTRMEGIVKEAHKNIGDEVKAGEVLAVIESKEHADLMADYYEADAQENLLRTLYEKDRNLYSKNIGSEIDLLNSQKNYESAELKKKLLLEKLLSLGITEEQLQNRSLSLLNLEIKAPIDGTVLYRHLSPGETVEVGNELYQLADLKTLWVELSIPYKDAALLRTGMPLTFCDNTGCKGSAKIERISPVVDEETGQVLAIASLNNTNKEWKPGSYVSAEVIIKYVKGNKVVPREAIITLEDQTGVFVADDEAISFRPVEIECQDKDYCLIQTGVEPGEKVVSKNAMRLKFELTKRDAHDD